MTKRAIANVRMILPHGIELGTMLIDGGRIVDVRTGPAAIAPDDYDLVDGGGRYCAPGLIDIHVHGGGGFDLMTDDIEQVRGYARWVATRGVTSFLVSTSGRDHAQIVQRLKAIAPAIGVEPGAARVLGFHLEGPYINPVRKGAFPPPWLRAPSADEYRELFEASGGTVRQMTLAPELPGADELIRAVVASGAVAAIGHTDATYEQAMRAIDLGATHVTHCFNAMRPFGHRDPGVLGAVMTSDALTAELIGDGAHVDYAAARVLVRAKGADRVVLITDGMPMAGTVGRRRRMGGPGDPRRRRQGGARRRQHDHRRRHHARPDRAERRRTPRRPVTRRRRDGIDERRASAEARGLRRARSGTRSGLRAA